MILLDKPQTVRILKRNTSYRAPWEDAGLFPTSATIGLLRMSSHPKWAITVQKMVSVSYHFRCCIPSRMFETCTGFSSIRRSNIGRWCESQVVAQPSVVDVCHARSCMNRGRSSPIVDIGSCTKVVPDLRRSDDSGGGELRITHLRYQVLAGDDYHYSRCEVSL